MPDRIDMEDRVELIKEYHHAKAAFEDKTDEWLLSLGPNDLLRTASDPIIHAACRQQFPDELERVRVAVINLDRLRERDGRDVEAAAASAHLAGKQAAVDQSLAWIQRKAIEQAILNGIEREA